MRNPFDLTDKVVFVTGGGGVLCGALAKALARHGARVAVADLAEEAAKRVADAIRTEGGQALAVKCDVLDRSSIEAALARAVAELGEVDALLNGAGGNQKQATTSDELPFFDLPADAMRFVLELNFTGTFLATQVVGKSMAARKNGVILNVSSMSALAPLTKVPGYSAAKAAVSNFTQWLAVHLCQHYSPEIRVNALAPGFFLTEQNRFLLTDEQSGELTARGKTIIDHTPMARFGQPEDLIGATLWLLSDASKFVTGIVLPIDGGFSAFGGV